MASVSSSVRLIGQCVAILQVARHDVVSVMLSGSLVVGGPSCRQQHIQEI